MKAKKEESKRFLRMVFFYLPYLFIVIIAIVAGLSAPPFPDHKDAPEPQPILAETPKNETFCEFLKHANVCSTGSEPNKDELFDACGFDVPNCEDVVPRATTCPCQKKRDAWVCPLGTSIEEFALCR